MNKFKASLFIVFITYLFFNHKSISQNTSNLFTKENSIINNKDKEKVEANFIASDSIICAGHYVTFTNLSPSGNKFIWYFEGGQPDSSFVKNPPVIYYFYPGSYTVSLTAIQSNDTNTLIKPKYIYVEDCSEKFVFIPNIFTPNEDGINDVIFIKGPDIVEAHMFIFDRWGKKVYEIHNLSQVWDGEINGQKAEQGTYVYYINLIFKDGDTQIKKGNFTLIR
jgi:gliding motility-associated-like protein